MQTSQQSTGYLFFRDSEGRLLPIALLLTGSVALCFNFNLAGNSLNIQCSPVPGSYGSVAVYKLGDNRPCNEPYQDWHLEASTTSTAATAFGVITPVL